MRVTGINDPLSAGLSTEASWEAHGGSGKLKDGRMLDLPLAMPLCALIVRLRREQTLPYGRFLSGVRTDAVGHGDVHISRIPVCGAAYSPGEEDAGRGSRSPTLPDMTQVDDVLRKSLKTVAALAEMERAKVYGSAM